MSGFARGALIGLAVLIAVCVVQYGMNYHTDWSAETKASVWVAIGTGLLAVATFWSLLETNLVIRGEDRRHQQSMVPIVTLQPSLHLEVGTARYKLLASNRGKGPAFNVLVNVSGVCGVRWEHHRVPPPKQGTYKVAHDSEQRDDVSLSETFMSKIIPDGEKNLPIYSEGLVTPVQETVERSLPTLSGDILNYDIHEATVDYTDMFGNCYKVVYTDFARERFEFIMPKSLRPQYPGLDRLERAIEKANKKRGAV